MNALLLLSGGIIFVFFTVSSVAVSFDEQLPESLSISDSGIRCLGACICYDSVKLVNCSGKSYDCVPYGIASDTMTLDMSHNAIPSVNAADFFDLHQVVSLDLSYNKISSLGLRPFENMLNLEVLKITDNANSMRARKDLFMGLENLIELNLYKGNFQSLGSGIFTSLKNLEVLNLDFNIIFYNDMNNNTFEGLINLKELSMASTYLTEVPMNAMIPIRSTLKRLSMRFSSRISSIGSTGSQKLDLPSLEVLDLAYGSIQVIFPGAFSKLPKLKLLDLTRNFLYALSPGSFYGLTNLESLNLSLNALSTFPYLALQPLSECLEELRLSEVFFASIGNLTGNISDVYLSNLKTLIIKDGRLENISGDSFFRSLHSLEYLDLSNNNMLRTPSEILIHLTNLETADFSNNFFSRISNGDIPSMSKMQILKLFGNQLNYLEEDAFDGLQIHTLQLANNKLKDIPPKIFNNQLNLTIIDLSNNLLKTPNPNWFAGRPLKQVLLQGNPWQCDCTIEEYYLWTQSSEYQGIDEIDTILCEQPRKLKNYPLPLLQLDALTCDFGECSSACICTDQSSYIFSPRISSLRESMNADYFDKMEGVHENGRLINPLYGDTYAISDSTYDTDCTGSQIEQFPSVPNTTVNLNIAQNSLGSLLVGDVTPLTNLETLIASDNLISFIENGSFSGLSYLRILYLNKNKLSTSISDSWFANLTSLSELRLDGNTLTGITDGAFSDLVNLKILDISENSITSLGSKTFIGLQNTEYLNLASNRINSIEITTFDSMEKLQYLYLNYNQLSSIPSSMIKQNIMLDYLDLSSNNFNVIEYSFLQSDSLNFLKMEQGYNPILRNGSFISLPNLEVLQLGYSYIQMIESEAFSLDGSGEESKLQTLDLGFNSISEVPLEALRVLTSLETLNLGGNYISALPTWNISGMILPNLRTLYLAQNQNLQDIPDDSFVSILFNLTALVVNQCSLKKVPTGALKSTSLEYIVLDGNPISEIGSDLSSLTRIRQFQFSDASSLKNISENGFKNLVNLERLILSDGKVEEIRPFAFENCVNIEIFDISNNLLTQPRPEWFAALDSNKVKSILMYGNPWICDSNACAYKKWIDDGAGSLNSYFVSFTCDSPQVYKGWLISEIATNDLQCNSTTTPGTPTAVPVTTEPSTTAKTVDCSKCSYDEKTLSGSCVESKLASVPKECFPKEIEKLDLSGNSIKSIQSDDFAGFQDLKELILSNNTISTISENAFTYAHSLERLELSFNDLHEIPSVALADLDVTLQVLYIDNQRISRIQENAFPLRNLRFLSMKSIVGENLISTVTIDDFAFAKLEELRELDLSYNDILSLGLNTLTGLHKLNRLDLSGTGLQSFPRTSMVRVSQLTELIMDENAISTLGPFYVTILRSLTKLSLRNNNLMSITEDCFLRRCGNIKEFDFGFSLLSYTPRSIFIDKPNLATIKLDHSRIVVISEGDFPTQFKGFIDLGYSNIVMLSSRAFADMGQLKLYLNDNTISSIAVDAFSDSSLQYLDLSNNYLNYISCSWIDNLPNDVIITIDFTGNRFYCTCDMAGYRAYLEATVYPPGVNVIGDVCSYPEEASGKDVETVLLEDMLEFCESGNTEPSYCGDMQ